MEWSSVVAHCITYTFVCALSFIILSIPPTERSKLIVDSIDAVILARGGSKGIKLKNLARLNNYTLLSRSITTAEETKRFKRIWVSTDNEAIANEATLFGALVHYREPYTATDHASSLEALKEFLLKHPDIETIALIQCTSPFMRAEDLIGGVEMMESGAYSSVFSTTRQFKLRWRKNERGEIESDNFSPMKRPRRQDWDGEIIENGMFYFSTRENVVEHNLLQAPRFGIIEVPFERSLEIDTPSDLKLAEMMINDGS